MTGILPATAVAPPPPARTAEPGGGRAFASSLAAALQQGAAPPLQRFITLGQMAGTSGTLAPGFELPLGAAAAVPGAGLAVAPAGPAAAGATGAVSGSEPAIVATARKYLGVPYRWGGTNPATGLDCSGFTQRVFADLGVKLPRVSVDQSKVGTKVASLAEARPGDLVFRSGSPNHIGIYLGDGQFIHAPRTGDVVKVAPLTWTPTQIRRVL